MRNTVHSWLKLVDALHYGRTKALSTDERNLVLQAAAPAGSDGEAGAAALCGILKGKGYDSIVYRNLHEDPGSLSVIALAPACVTIMAVQEMDGSSQDVEAISLPAP